MKWVTRRTEHGDRAAVGDPYPLDALHGGGLAGAVGAEDPEDLSPLHGQRQVVHDHPVAVPLP
jgi:hypothetical protein